MTSVSVVQSPNDPRKYRSLQLKNGLRALLISDKQKPESKSKDSEKLSAAALCVGVGSFSDPSDIPGLAHFLEHMVFMGSEKYPDENGFDNFIKLSGGNNNAYTECERTVFYFDCGIQHFNEGLDRFAQFFIKPLMKVDSVDREIKAVDSEFDMSLTSDKHRVEQLVGMMASDGHPMGKFFWGNSQTLKTRPTQQGIDIHTRLREFYDSSYSAHYMTLAVHSRDDLDTLEKWVTDIFSGVPNTGKPQPSFTALPQPFDSARFHKLYKAVPVKNIHQVVVLWSLPCLQQEYMKKPLHYLGFILGHEGAGSLLSFLKKRLWALSLEAGSDESGFDHSSTCALLSVTVTLTPLGMEHIQEVLTAVFQYLAMLRKEGPQERLFQEIKTIEDNDFRWQEQCEPGEYVEGLCDNMQLYPTEHYISGPCLLYQFDSKLLSDVQNALIPSKACIILYSKTLSSECDLQEPYFQTKYCVQDIPQEWSGKWQDNGIPAEFHFPAENAYIATDFSLVTADVDCTDYPKLLTDSEQSKLWFKKDNKFNVPRGYIYFILKTPIIASSPSNFAIFDLFLSVLRENLNEVAYAADSAQLSYEVTGNSQGLIIKLSGFNHKLQKLFETIVEHIKNFDVAEDLFCTMKEQLQRIYHNRIINPKTLAGEVRLSFLQHPCWSTVQRHRSLKHITRQMLLAFKQQLQSEVFVEGYIHGNFSQQDARNIEKHLLDKLGSDSLPKMAIPETRVLSLPIGEHFCRVENYNQNDNNSVIVMYSQYGPGDLKLSTLNELLQLRMEEPCFDMLRTRLQLGYDVYCTNHDTDGILGFSVTVCSQANKFSMSQLTDYIHAFYKEFKTSFDELSPEEFKSMVESMIVLKRCEDSHMGEEADRNWEEVISGYCLFDRLPRQIQLLKEMPIDEFKSWFFKQIPSDVEEHRALNVQVVGNANAKGAAGRDVMEEEELGSSGEDEEMDDEKDDDDDDDDDDDEEEEDMVDDDGDMERTQKLIFVDTEADIQSRTITDIRQFCDKQSLYPVTLIV